MAENYLRPAQDCGPTEEARKHQCLIHKECCPKNKEQPKVKVDAASAKKSNTVVKAKEPIPAPPPQKISSKKL